MSQHYYPAHSALLGKMTSKFTPALAHIRLMEDRIRQQAATIEQLRLSGRETSAAFLRLSLLQHALEEMRIQLGSISPTELDAKRANIAAALKTLSKGKTSS